MRKALNIAINTDALNRLALHKFIQRILFEHGFGWNNGGQTVQMYNESTMHIVLEGSKKKIFRLYDDEAEAVLATNIISGTFDLDKWINESSPVEEGKYTIYCVDLSWVHGKAREILSEAIQKKAFEKGYYWQTNKAEVLHTTSEGLFLYELDNSICYGDDFKGCTTDSRFYNHVEVSVNNALKGEYPSVKGGKK